MKKQPAHRPRFDPKVTRKLQTYRLHPNTIRNIRIMADREQISRGLLIDRMFLEMR